MKIKQKKKILIQFLVSMWLFLALYFYVVCRVNANNKKINVNEITNTETTLIEETTSIISSIETENETMQDVTQNIYDRLNQEISGIPYDYTSEKKEWFITYKNIIDKYPKAMFVTIYDVFPDEELELLFRVVQAEVGDFDFISKANVVSVILNRHYHFQTSLSSVLLAEHQFATIDNGRYLEVEIDEDTILACEYVFLFGDTTNGAMYFDSTNGNSWAAHNREFIFRDSAGHDFYK